MNSCYHVLSVSAAAVLFSSAPHAEISVEPEFLKDDHVIDVDGQSIHAWEVAALSATGEVSAARGVVVFLHGGTWSGRPNFDIDFEDYSTMEHFARAGWDTFAFDAQGYGSSSDPKEGSWSEASDVVVDLHALVEEITQLRSVERVSLIGWSWGSQVAALFAQKHPEMTQRVVLYGTRWQGFEDAPDAPTERFRTSSIKDTKSDFIEGCYDPAFVEAYARAAIAADPDSPNGVYRDYFVNLPIIDPETLLAPTLIVAGEHEARGSMDDIAPLFRALKSPDKQLAVIPGGGHAVHLEKGRHRWRSTVLAFLGT